MPAVGLDHDEANLSMVDTAAVDLHAASRITDRAHLPRSPVVASAGPPAPDPPGAPTVGLPAAAAPPRRGLVDRSSALSFHPAPVRLDQLATVLAAATRGYPSDVAGTAEGAPPIALYCVGSAMAGLADGVHRYDPVAHAAVCRREGAPDRMLRAATTGLDPHLVSASVSLFLVGRYRATAGARWYRVTNLLAGVALQRICGAAATVGWGSRPNLGFDPVAVARLLELAPGQTPLVQVLLGHPAPRPGCLDLHLREPEPGPAMSQVVRR